MRRIEVEEVRCAMNGMKITKVSGSSGVANRIVQSLCE